MNINVEEFYTKYSPMVMRRCIALLKNEEKAADAMQETFIKLLRYKEKLSGRYPSSLLFTIATNVCLNQIRSEKQFEDIDALELTCTDNPAGAIENADMLLKIFSHEKEDTALIAVMAYIDGMTLAQIAREVGMSEAGVRKRLSTLKAKVKNIKEVL